MLMCNSIKDTFPFDGCPNPGTFFTSQAAPVQQHVPFDTSAASERDAIEVKLRIRPARPTRANTTDDGKHWNAEETRALRPNCTIRGERSMDTRHATKEASRLRRWDVQQPS